MNTHKEPKFKVRDWVVVNGYRNGEIGYIEEVDLDDTETPYTVRFEGANKGSAYYEESSLAPLEPKETPHSESQNIGHPNRYGVEPVEPTPPSQIDPPDNTELDYWRQRVLEDTGGARMSDVLVMLIDEIKALKAINKLTKEQI